MLAAAWAAMIATATGASPSTSMVMPGWPRPAPAGELFAGPGGGVVSLTEVGSHEVGAAYDTSGRLLWAFQREPRCGNCLSGTQRPRLWPDGTYGPIGPTGSDFWAVDQRGREVAGCRGPVLADGACVASGSAFALHPAVTMSRGGAEAWRHVEADLNWDPEVADWPAPVVDLAGNVYAAFGNAYPSAPGRDRTRVISLDPGTGGLRWRRLMPARVVDGLESGVLVDLDGTAVALDAQGAERWRLDATLGAPVQAIPDTPRGRVLVVLRRGDSARVASVVLADAAVRWITPSARAAQAVSIGATGITYVGLDTGGTVHQLRAIRPDGTVAWLLPTAASATGVPELADRTVMVATSDLHGGLLTRVDPRRAGPAARRTRIDIQPRRMAVGCGLICGLTPGRGGILTIRTPAPLRIRFFVVEPGGHRRRSVALSLPVNAPRGTSHLRFAAAVDDGTGPVTLEARWRTNGRLRSQQVHLDVNGLSPFRQP